MKKLLFVTTRLPWPCHSGRRVSLWHYCRGLSERYGYEVSLFSFTEWDQPRDDADKPDFIREVRFAPEISGGAKFASLFRHALFGRWPLQCALFYSRATARALHDYAAELAPDVIVFDMIRTTPYLNAVSDIPALKILDLDDLLSRRYERQLAVKDAGKVAGNYENTLSPALRSLSRGALGRMALRVERKRVARAELAYPKRADGVIFVSETEADHFNELFGKKIAAAVPLGVDTAAFSVARDAEKAPRVMSFVGNLNVAANEAALDRIVREILPLLRENATLRVIGPTPDEVAARYRDNPAVDLRGTVEDLAAALGETAFLLSPLPFGSGVKTKILEAMAAGLPVVTNAVGAEDIGATEAEGLLVAETPEALAAMADALLADPTRCEALGKAAAAFIDVNFSWEKSFDRFAVLGL